MTGPLAGRVIAVTGAARGIGLATAREAIRQGARVAVGDLDATALDAAMAALGSRAWPFVLDVTDERAFQRFLDGAEQLLGPLDALVNNAGIMPLGPLLAQEDRTARRILEVNTLGVITGTKLALLAMLPRGRGHIVNVASTAGVAYVPGAATYCASKHAVVGFTDAVRMELRGRGIHFTTVLPGFTNTELIAGTAGVRGFKNREPEEVAHAILGALIQPRRRVYVPRAAGPILMLMGLVPAGIAEAFGRMLGTDRVFLELDAERRREYEQRVRR